MGEAKVLDLENTFIPPLGGWVDVVALAAGAAETYTVPAGMQYLMFSSPAGFWVRAGGTAAIPSADVTDGTAAEFSPTMRQVRGSATFSLISDADTHVTITAYKGSDRA